MIFFKVFLQIYFEGKAIGDYKDFAETLINAKESIWDKFLKTNSKAYSAENNTIKLITDLIASHLVDKEPEHNGAVRDVVERLNLSSIETRYTEYKIGFTFFDTPPGNRHNEGKLNFANVRQIAKVACAMTNIKRKATMPGMIILNYSRHNRESG